jgi:hypothetical protein
MAENELLKSAVLGSVIFMPDHFTAMRMCSSPLFYSSHLSILLAEVVGLPSPDRNHLFHFGKGLRIVYEFLVELGG